jgi:hypothetical protein
MTAQPSLRIFYSWQSDLPDATNRGAIRRALRDAANRAEADLAGCHIVLDEAVRGISGSPNIPDEILKKVEVADIFVADVTTVISTDGGRSSPNPNVVFELGYAVAHLGWNRIVLLVNAELSKLEDLPFDFDRHRASPFHMPANASKEERKALADLLFVAIRAVVNASPKRPAELRGLSPDQLRRNRDIENLRAILSTLHIPSLDEFCSEAPKFIRPGLFHFWYAFSSVYESSLFHLYDDVLREAFDRFYKAWDETLSYGQYYNDNAGGTHVFGGSNSHSIEARRAYDHLCRTVDDVKKALGDILKEVRERYIEISIDDTNGRAWEEYLNFRKSMDEKLDC